MRHTQRINISSVAYTTEQCKRAKAATQADSTPTTPNPNMKINIKGSSESVRFSVDDAEPAWTVEQLKARCEAQCGVAASAQRLIFSGHVLKNQATLESYSASRPSRHVQLPLGAPAAPGAQNRHPTPGE